MSFRDEFEAFHEEMDAFYSTYPANVEGLLAEMDRVSAEHPQWGPCRRKALIYETAARRCEVKVFRHFPYFYEVVGGRERHRWGFQGVGYWLRTQPPQQELADRAGQQVWRRMESGLSHGSGVVDHDHHCVGFDNVLALGLEGLIDRAAERLARGVDEAGRDFLDGAIIGCKAMIALAGRFADRARELAEDEADPVVRRRLERTAESADRVPAKPPRTFHEALNAILFLREVCGSVEGIGESILGHLDRMTWPYLQADLDAGRATPDDARDSIEAFLAMTDAKCNIRREPRETSTTVVIGGCDRDGEPVYNPVTDLILDAYRDLTLVNPKLNARLSPRHPQAYVRRLADLASRTNVMAIFNDDVIVAANVRAGKAVEDARLYVGGGCQENVLQNTEISSRASIYLNLAHVLLMGFFPEQWAEYASSAGVAIEPYAGSETFEEFRRRFLANLRAVHDEHVETRNATEREGGWYNPCPLHSATMDDCIERARDMFAGGTRYAGASVSLIGAGTLIDSLRAVEQAVYERGELTLEELAGLLETDFAGAEAMRSYLAKRIGKFGSDDPATAEFAAGVLRDLARVTTGKPNTRGGRYEASLFVYRAFRRMGEKTGATPDGRRAGEWLSPGMSPSPLGLAGGAGVASVLGALEPLDLTDYPVVAVLDLKLPWAGAGLKGEVVESVIRRFLDAGGSVLQLNVIDPSELADAREHPDRHGDLVVRVSGYSARFTTLPEHIQDEIIGRTTVAV